MTVDEYLAWEARQSGRNEYVDGEVFAMVDVTRRHASVAINLVNVLSANRADGPCRVYASDMKLQIEASAAFYYPDVFVTCDPHDHQADAYMSSAVLVIEVLSGSTAAYDRGDKFAAYRRLSSLKECVLIDPDRKQIECFRRGEQGPWVLHEPDAQGSLVLESIGLLLTAVSAFQRVD